jgi:DNA repair exonuclease SbcCD nuclease subunit
MCGDVHVGSRNASTVMLNYTARFFNDLLIPYMNKHNIDQLVTPGDLFESRKQTNNNCLHDAKKLIFDKLQSAGITLHVTIGNHDIFYRETLEVNTPNLLLSDYPNVKIYSKPTKVVFDKTSVDMIPWICDENRLEIAKFVNESNSTFAFGHWEFSGYDMYRNIPSHGGMSIDDYKRYSEVFSGHYHTKSKKENVRYLGTPVGTTWQDYNDQKGFYVLETTTGEVEFIPNPETVFDIIEYDDSKEDYSKHDTSIYNGKYIKIIILNKTDYYNYDLFLGKIFNSGCNDIKIIEDMSAYKNGELDETIDLADTREILNHYVDTLPDDNIDKDKVKMLLNRLYIESVNMVVN